MQQICKWYALFLIVASSNYLRKGKGVFVDKIVFIVQFLPYRHEITGHFTKWEIPMAVGRVARSSSCYI